MQDIMTRLEHLKRPPLLIRAARLCAESYNREGQLARLLGYGQTAEGRALVLRLLDLENDLDARRRADDAGYSVFRHIDVLAALMAEARALRRGPDASNLSTIT